MALPFETKDDDLIRLNPQEAVELFRRLIWAESSLIGISQNLINVPTCINVFDGGLDAYIELSKPSLVLIGITLLATIQY